MLYKSICENSGFYRLSDGQWGSVDQTNVSK